MRRGAGYLQRYHIRRSQMDPTSFVMAMGAGAHGHWILGHDAIYQRGTLPDSNVSGPLVLVYGTPADTLHPFGDVPLQNAIIMQIGTFGRTGPAVLALVRAAAAAGAKGWITVAAVPTQFWTGQLRNATTPQLNLIGGQPGGRNAALPIPMFLVRDSNAIGVLEAAGEHLDSLRVAGASGVRPLRGFTGAFSARRTELPEASAPNVVGILEGSDPVLKNEYVFFTGHMDHIAWRAAATAAPRPAPTRSAMAPTTTPRAPPAW